MGWTALGAEELANVMVSYRDALSLHKEALNRLNVYPVPDGDTGTNMTLTLESVVKQISEDTYWGLSDPQGSGNGDSIQGGGSHDRSPAMVKVCKAISHGSLMGARGNSGVILSQILRGMTDELKGLEQVDSDKFSQALARGSESAYSAVMRPVEGTILTVSKAAASAALASAKRGCDLPEVMDEACTAGQSALDRTPELLPVLAEAGVVDAGGAGFVLLLHAFLNVIDGREIPAPPAGEDAASAMAGPLDLSFHEVSQQSGSTEISIADLRYEVMYLLEAPDEAVPAFKDLWAALGDSIVVVGGDGLWNCHIHTDDIGGAIEASLDVGRPRSIRVTDLAEQVGKLEELEEERWVREASLEQQGNEVPYSGPQVTTAVVAVSNGDGIRRIFASLGVHGIIHGGQSMNPSTQDVLDAIDHAPADQVIVLPNNSNIIAVAEQAAKLATKDVRVVPTKGVPQAFEALLLYDPDASADANADSMEGAVASAVYGEVTRAVRDASSPAGAIKAGDWLGLSAHGIEVVGDSLDTAACGLLDILVKDGAEVVTIIEGEGSSKAETRHITVWLSDNRPGVEVEIHHGGQPLYPYLFGVD